MDKFGLIGLKRRRSVARLAANLIPSGYGAMTVDGGGGVAVGLTSWDNCTPVFLLDNGQKVTLGGVTDADQFAAVYLAFIAISPNTIYTLSVDAALLKSATERVKVQIQWFTSASAYISNSVTAEVDPGVSYARQTVTGTAPATAAKAFIQFEIHAKAIGATGVAHFKDALFQAA